MKKTIIMISVLLLSMTQIVFAENRSANKELLEEIEIMEAVLNKLIATTESEMPFQGTNTKGFYLSGYGVVFNTSYHTSPLGGVAVISTAPPPPVLPEDPSKSFKLNRVEIKRDGKNKEKKDIIAEIKKTLLTFFSKYASTLSGLKPDEKIAIILDLNRFAFIRSQPKDDLPYELSATILMNDVLSFKKDKISIKDLEKRVVFDEIRSIDEDASIFSSVIETSLNHQKRNSGLAFPGNVETVKSAFIQGYGIVFMTNVDVGTERFSLILRGPEGSMRETESAMETLETRMNLITRKRRTSDELDTDESEKIADKSEKHEEETVMLNSETDDFKEYEDKLVEILSKYGHTLSKIKTDEWVVIALDLNGMRVDTKFSNSIIKVKKGDIDKFNKGKTDFDSFRKNVSVFHQ